MRRIDVLRGAQAIEAQNPGRAPSWKEMLAAMVELVEASMDWAHELDRIHTKTFIGPGPHPELKAFRAREHRLRELAHSWNEAQYHPTKGELEIRLHV